MWHEYQHCMRQSNETAKRPFRFCTIHEKKSIAAKRAIAVAYKIHVKFSDRLTKNSTSRRWINFRKKEQTHCPRCNRRHRQQQRLLFFFFFFSSPKLKVDVIWLFLSGAQCAIACNELINKKKTKKEQIIKNSPILRKKERKKHTHTYIFSENSYVWLKILVNFVFCSR